MGLGAHVLSRPPPPVDTPLDPFILYENPSVITTFYIDHRRLETIIGVRDQFRLGGLRSVARIFYSLLARKSLQVVLPEYYMISFCPKMANLKNSRGLHCSPPPPPPASYAYARDYGLNYIFLQGALGVDREHHPPPNPQKHRIHTKVRTCFSFLPPNLIISVTPRRVRKRGWGC